MKIPTASAPLLTILVLLLAGTMPGAMAAEPGVTPSPVQLPFSARSIWNQPIGPNPALAPNSPQQIQYLVSDLSRVPVILPGVDQYWSVPVYQTDASTPRYPIRDVHGNAINDVPVPSSVLLDPTPDSKIVFVDPVSSPARAYSFSAFRRSGNGYTAGSSGWGDITPNGDGLSNFEGGRWGGRATGWNYLAGLITPSEIQQGRIDHALLMSLDASVVSSDHVWPANGADGYSRNPSALHEGARLQLDPSIDINSLKLSAGGKIIARALQVYGAWLGDTGSATAFYAQEFLTLDSSGRIALDQRPWAGLLSGDDLSAFPTGSLRVLQVNPNDFFVNTSPDPSPPSWPPTLEPEPAGNALSNPDFESDIGPWIGWQADITLIGDAHTGSHAAEVAFAGNSIRMYSIDNGPPGEFPAVAGASYFASAWVKGIPGRTARLVIRESNGTRENEQPGPPVVLDGTWQQLTATYTGKYGDPIDIYIVQLGAQLGDSFTVDDIFLSEPPATRASQFDETSALAVELKSSP